MQMRLRVFNGKDFAEVSLESVAIFWLGEYTFHAKKNMIAWFLFCHGLDVF